MSSPFFSIITPVFNAANTIRRTIESVLNQSFQDFEIVIIDDGSMDTSKEVIERIADHRIRYQWQINAGPSAARNFGAKLACGQYFIFLDSDDCLTENYLQSFYELLRSGKFSLGLACAHFVNSNNDTIRKIKPWNSGTTFGPGLCGAYVISRFLFDACHGFDVNLFFSENSDLFLTLRTQGKLNSGAMALNDRAEVTIEMIDRRERQSKYSKKKYVSVQYFLTKHKRYFDKSLNDFINFKRIHAICALQNGDIKEAKRSLLEIIRRKPDSIKTYLQYLIFLFPRIAKKYYGR
jgi:glycosyltransferase involved in cell wall biosynthesis